MLSPQMSTLGLKIKIVPFLIFLSEGRIPPKATEKPGPLTAFLTSRITVGYFSMVFLILLFFAMQKATCRKLLLLQSQYSSQEGMRGRERRRSQKEQQKGRKREGPIARRRCQVKRWLAGSGGGCHSYPACGFASFSLSSCTESLNP